MGDPLDRVTVLRDAYKWEIDRINEWANDMDATPGNSVNAMADRFDKTWREYFQELLVSNTKALDICDAAVTQNDDTGAKVAMKEINRRFHRRETIANLSEDVAGKSLYSEYYKALSAALDLELEARDYIEHYSKTGIII